MASLPLLLLLHSLVNHGPCLLPPPLSNSDLFLSFLLPIFLLLKPLPSPKAPVTPPPSLVRCSKLFSLDPCSVYGTSLTSTSIFTTNRYYFILFMRSIFSMFILITIFVLFIHFFGEVDCTL